MIIDILRDLWNQESKMSDVSDPAIGQEITREDSKGRSEGGRTRADNEKARSASRIDGLDTSSSTSMTCMSDCTCMCVRV